MSKKSPKPSCSHDNEEQKPEQSCGEDHGDRKHLQVQEEMPEHRADCIKQIVGERFICVVCESHYSNSDLKSHWSSKEHRDKKLKSVDTVNVGASTSKQSNAPKMTVFKQNYNRFEGNDDDPWDFYTGDYFKEESQMDIEKIQDSLVTFREDNYISLIEDLNINHCNLCDQYIVGNIKDLKEHVKQVEHLSNLFKLLNISKSDTTNASKE